MKEKLPRTFVVGGAGFIGRALLSACRASGIGHEGTDRDGRGGLLRLDLAQPDLRPLRLAEKSYDWAVIAAGAGNPARCEREPAWTRARNVDGTLALARSLSELGLRVAFITTDYVFDGTKGDYADDEPPSPILEYGRQKADVERALGAACGGRALIVRPGKIFGDTPGDGTLLDEMAVRLRSGQPVRAAVDQRFCPILIHDFIRAVLALLSAGASGVVNVGGPEAISRYDLAQRVARAVGAPAPLVEPISLDDLQEPFRRPKNTTMRRGRLEALVPSSWTPLEECIARVAV